ncbi:hypothetical protein GX51_02147 [Blastomyces parvus]|uniref:Uncharacterized protein n=1 Tax=Blastomyces parvus TaxID=2060905 RepID=A0A2B7XDU1_9EURO|nr:hypothetical protein GX51_02147 [Blastomyces parvus]
MAGGRLAFRTWTSGRQPRGQSQADGKTPYQPQMMRSAYDVELNDAKKPTNRQQLSVMTSFKGLPRRARGDSGRAWMSDCSTRAYPVMFLLIYSWLSGYQILAQKNGIVGLPYIIQKDHLFLPVLVIIALLFPSASLEHQ